MASIDSGKRIYADGTYLAHNPAWHEEDSPYKASLVKRMIDRAGLAPKTIADVGCGAGLVTEIVSRTFDARVVGFDTSADASRFWPQRHADNLRFVLGDYASGEERFDLALCLDVFEHVPDYLGFIASLRSKSDYVIFNIPLDMCVAKLLSPGLRMVRENVGHLHYFNSYTAAETVRYAGYTIVDSFLATPVFSLPPHNVPQAIMALPRMALALISHSAAATLVGGYSLVVLAKS